MVAQVPAVRDAYLAQGPFSLVLDATPGDVRDWHLTHDPQGWFAGMSWRSEPAEMGAFAERNEWLSTSPESGFLDVMTDGFGLDVGTPSDAALDELWIRAHDAHLAWEAAGRP